MIDRGQADDNIVAGLKMIRPMVTGRTYSRSLRHLIDRLRHYFLTYKCWPAGSPAPASSRQSVNAYTDMLLVQTSAANQVRPLDAHRQLLEGYLYGVARVLLSGSGLQFATAFG